MATQILNGIYQLKVPIPNSPLENTNVYLLQGDKNYTLIDTGWDSKTAFNSLNRQLAEVGIGFRDIAQIIVTHAHFDHYGLTEKIKQVSDAKILMHNAEKTVLRSRYAVDKKFLDEVVIWFRRNGVPERMLTAVHGPISGFGKTLPAQPDVLLNGDETISSGDFNLKVIWTPGHSPGHICLYEPERKVLFSGDHVLPSITPNVSLPPNPTGNPLGDYIKSLLTVQKLAVELVLPGHENTFNNLSKRVDEIIYHHEKRSVEILKAMKHQEMTAYQIANLVTWMPEQGGVKHDDLAPLAKLAAVSETMAHLKAMSVEGKVSTTVRDSVLFWSALPAEK
jgi:glyoxylase-like metal-dependent hydrolase (beta-lactamase superfamily II)